MGIPDHFTCLLRNLHHVNNQQLEPDMEQLIYSKLGKEYDKAVLLVHPAYLTYLQSTFCGLYNLIVNTSKRVLFLPSSDAYVKSSE